MRKNYVVFGPTSGRGMPISGGCCHSTKMDVPEQHGCTQERCRSAKRQQAGQMYGMTGSNDGGLVVDLLLRNLYTLRG